MYDYTYIIMFGYVWFNSVSDLGFIDDIFKNALVELKGVYKLCIYF